MTHIAFRHGDVVATLVGDRIESWRFEGDTRVLITLNSGRVVEHTAPADAVDWRRKMDDALLYATGRSGEFGRNTIVCAE